MLTDDTKYRVVLLYIAFLVFLPRNQSFAIKSCRDKNSCRSFARLLAWWVRTFVRCFLQVYERHALACLSVFAITFSLSTAQPIFCYQSCRDKNSCRSFARLLAWWVRTFVRYVADMLTNDTMFRVVLLYIACLPLRTFVRQIFDLFTKDTRLRVFLPYAAFTKNIPLIFIGIDFLDNAADCVVI